MKISIFWGELTDISAEKEALVTFHHLFLYFVAIIDSEYCANSQYATCICGMARSVCYSPVVTLMSLGFFRLFVSLSLASA